MKQVVSLSPAGERVGVRGSVALALACLALLGCPLKPPPGDVAMGQYAISASSGVVGYLSDGGIEADGGEAPVCQLMEVSSGDFTFDATLTRQSTSDVAWMTLNGYSREGTFDGQVLSTTAQANRVFATMACSKCSTRVVETITVAVLSRSQNEAVSSQCPENATTGGVPVDPDAGILAPGQAVQSYDAVRLCGELTTVVVALGLVDGGACAPECGGCTVRYQLRGDRR